MVQRRFQMPDPFELPRMLSAVVPHVGSRNAVVDEFVALACRHSVRSFQFIRCAPGRLPGFSSVIGSLNHLAKPPAGLRRINTVRIQRRTFQMIKLPARKVRPINFPILALAIGSEDECAFARPDEYSNSAHLLLPPVVPNLLMPVGSRHKPEALR